MTTYHRTFLVSLGQVFLAVFLLVYAAPTQAAAPIESLVVGVKLEETGLITITQAIEYITPQQLNWTLFSSARDLIVTADGIFIEARSQSSNGNTLISADRYARHWQLQYQTPSNLVRHNNRDQLFLKVLDQSNSAIFSTSITFDLPPNSGESGLVGNIYAISGVETPQTTQSAPTQITYSSQYTGPAALLTISANWSKDVLGLSPIQEALLSFYQLDAAPWLALGLLLPLASLIVLARLLIAQRRSEQTITDTHNQPPAATSAIIAGVIVHKRIHPEEIAALIIDLCQRGYLLIVKRSQSYSLVKRKPADHLLQNWERQIIDELLPTTGKGSGEIKPRPLSSQSLYSPRVRSAFDAIYQVVTDQGYFSENPHHTRIKYKLFALFLYFSSAGGMIWLAISAGSPYLILPLAGTIIVSQLIIKTSPRIAHYSRAGVSERHRWLEFANWLSASKPLPFELSRNHTFEKYLPYAVALGKTLPWAKRFDYSSIAILKPDWFVAYEDSSTVEFAKEIAGFIKEISSGITSLHGPLVG